MCLRISLIIVTFTIRSLTLKKVGSHWRVVIESVCHYWLASKLNGSGVQISKWPCIEVIFVSEGKMYTWFYNFFHFCQYYWNLINMLLLMSISCYFVLQRTCTLHFHLRYYGTFKATENYGNTVKMVYQPISSLFFEMTTSHRWWIWFLNPQQPEAI